MLFPPDSRCGCEKPLPGDVHLRLGEPHALETFTLALCLQVHALQGKSFNILELQILHLCNGIMHMWVSISYEVQSLSAHKTIPLFSGYYICPLLILLYSLCFLLKCLHNSHKRDVQHIFLQWIHELTTFGEEYFFKHKVHTLKRFLCEFKPWVKTCSFLKTYIFYRVKGLTTLNTGYVTIITFPLLHLLKAIYS